MQRGDSVDDSGEKNAWRCEWMEKEVGEERLGQYLRKIARSGLAYCRVCRSEIKYGLRGSVALEEHTASEKASEESGVTKKKVGRKNFVSEAKKAKQPHATARPVSSTQALVGDESQTVCSTQASVSVAGAQNKAYKQTSVANFFNFKASSSNCQRQY